MNDQNAKRFGENFDYNNETFDYCVYAHVCKVKGEDYGKTYIGVTNSVKRRWQNNGTEYTGSRFYKDVQKYGWNNFEHIVLINNVSLSMASELEKSLIKKYNTNYRTGGWGYNANNGGLGKQEKYDNIKIIKVDYLGNVVDTFDDVYSISNDPWAIEAIIKSCKQRKNSFMYKGYLWFFEDDFNEQNLNERLSKLTYSHLRKVEKYAHKGGVVQYDLYNNVIAEYKNPKEVEEKTGIDARFIVNTCLGKTNTAHGYQWKYKDDPKPNTLLLMHIKVAKVDLDTNKILEIFNNQRDAAKSINARTSRISECARGIRNNYKEFTWRYLDQNNNIIEPENLY